MAINLRKNITASAPGADEELRVNGLTAILYDTIVLKNKISNAQFDELTKDDDHFKKVTSDSDYIDKMFSLDENQKRDHQLMLSDRQIDIEPFELSSKVSVKTGKLNIYMTLYARQFILVQIVGLIDNNRITRYKNQLEVNGTLNTDDILKLFDTLHKNNHTNQNKNIINIKKEETNRFLKRINLSIEDLDSLSNRVSQPLALQIWDIADLGLNDGDRIKGTDLAMHYAWELSAILSFYTEHFRTGGKWRGRRKDQVEREYKRMTDVLGDHRVIFNERVCLEISQVDHPNLDPVSEKRLYSYGYDSTSIFLWGYLNLQEAACEFYTKQAKRSLQRIEAELNGWAGYGEKNSTINSSQDSNHNKIIILSEFVTHRLKIIDAVEKHLSIWTLCLEDRHRNFIRDNASLRKIEDKVKEIQKISNNANEMAMDFTRVILAIQSEKANKNQSKMMMRLSILSFLIGGFGIVPMTDFIIGFHESINTPYWKGSIAFLLFLVLTLIIYCTIKYNPENK